MGMGWLEVDFKHYFNQCNILTRKTPPHSYFWLISSSRLQNDFLWLHDDICLIHMIENFSDMATSNTQDQNWLMLSHPGIFEKIMLMIGLDSLESLDNCRQVCKTWNAMIMNKIWENPTKKWGTIIQRRIERSWERIIVSKDYDYDYDYDYPSDEKISQAKMLG